MVISTESPISAEHYLHVVLKNKYDQVFPNNPNGFISLDMAIHNQTTELYYEYYPQLAASTGLSDVQIWHSIILQLSKKMYRELELYETQH